MKYIELFYNQRRVQKDLNFKTLNKWQQNFTRLLHEISQVRVSSKLSTHQKEHIIHGSVYLIRKETQATLFKYIEIYHHRKRRHSANGWVSTEAFEQQYYENLEGSSV